MTVDDYTPRYVGNLGNPLNITFTDHEGTAFNLAGNSAGDFTLKLVPLGGGATITGTGAWAISTSANGTTVQYQWAAADVATAGRYLIRVTANISGSPVTFDGKILDILP